MPQRGMTYDGSIERYPIVEGEVYTLPNGSRLAIGDLMKTLHPYMKEAECIFSDPPCSRGNLKTFYTKADIEGQPEITAFFETICRRIEEINPKHVFLELFKSDYNYFVDYLKSRYKHVTVFENTYYHKADCRCWIAYASDEPCGIDLNGMDEWEAVYKIAREVPVGCLGDFCMGRGLVAEASYAAGKKFVGSELNRNRLAVAIARVAKKGGQWTVEKQ